MISLCHDIEFAVVKLVQQMANFSNKHYQAKLHLYRYLLNTCEYYIVYYRLRNESVITYSDSGWAQAHKSVTGYFTLIAYRVIS